MLEVILMGVYTAGMLGILVYSLLQFQLVLRYRRFHKRTSQAVITPPEPAEWPMVTIQLPVYNEVYVIGRLIDACAGFDYPRDRFEIQVLDDSTDETVSVVAAKVAEWQAQGVNIAQIRRADRKGYKAGALQQGLARAKGAYICIFDADFIPPSDFLRKTIPHFQDAGVGVVQTRWGHTNRDYNLLTRLQAFGLDAHFTIEQQGRNSSGCFINFNGTAGIWRRAAIEDAGGWQSDTITEDLDLSYRAQVKGWRFVYLEDVVSPAELPAHMPGVKSQQFRWNKGGAECARKNMGRVFRADIPLHTRIHAVSHLLNSTVFLIILITSILSVPLVYIKENQPEFSLYFQVSGIFIIASLTLLAFYWTATRVGGPTGWARFREFMVYYPAFLAISMGMALHNSVAVLEGYLGIKSPFVRTPKYNLNNIQGSWKGKVYAHARISPLTWMEALMSLYFMAATCMDFYYAEIGMFIYHAMLTVGYSMLFIYSVIHAGGGRS